MSTAAEKRHMGRVAELGCIICTEPAQVHHIRDGQGMSQRASNWLVIPLCPEHHMGALSVHKTPKQFANIYGSELDLLALTLEKLA
jgi:hypothetical protein